MVGAARGQDDDDYDEDYYETTENDDIIKTRATTMTKDGESTVSQASLPMTAFQYFDGSIAPYNGEDKAYSSTKWAQDIEDNAAVFGWNAQQKLIMARRSLCGTAALWLKSEKVFRSYEELKAALLKEFPDVTNSKEMHEIMAARKKNKDETFLQYMLIMKEYGKRAKFPDYVAIQYIIDGIQDTQANKIILYGVTTYGVLKEKLAIYEKMKADCRAEVAVKKGASTTSTFRRCYNCGQRNHVSSQCPNGPKCFKCNQFGHIGPRCTSATTTAASGSVGGSSSMTSHRNMATTSAAVKQPVSGQAQVRTNRNAAPVASVKQRAAMFGTTETPLANQHECCGSHDRECVDEMSKSNLDFAGVMMNVNKDSKQVANKNYDGKPIKRVLINESYSSDALIDSGSDVNLISIPQILGARPFDRRA
ncbi:uncharacterized protein LOC128681110 [Plodia interpunctella]|uniref:uncharacterized protein LOC128681110 n=1 Tax=Plodia interpunctella TaxID=58824 RepID=UPI0023689BF9|nr:uncharacterized protein LOC128681110 [Plodia interpunctella]